jgi:uncharacterized tellurite resistance protein B-like protein
MYSELSENEKLAIVGVFKFVVNSNGTLDNQELDKMQEFIEEKNFNDFSDVLDLFEKSYDTIEDFYGLLEGIDEERRDLLLEEAYELAISDGYATPAEMEIFDIMAQAWDTTKKELLKRIK